MGLMHIEPDLVPSMLPGPISILELRHVRETFLPSAIIKLIPLEEIARRKAEIDNQHPHLEEETAWVQYDEERRRQRALEPHLRLA